MNWIMRLNICIETFRPHLLDEVTLVEDYQEALCSLNESVKKYSKAVRALGKMADPNLQSWKDCLAKHESDLNMYRREIRRRSTDLQGQGAQITPVAAATATPKTTDLTSFSSLAQEQLNFDRDRLARDRRVASATAKSALDSIKQDLKELNDEYSEHRDWAEADDSAVEKAMGSKRRWREKLS